MTNDSNDSINCLKRQDSECGGPEAAAIEYAVAHNLRHIKTSNGGDALIGFDDFAVAEAAAADLGGEVRDLRRLPGGRGRVYEDRGKAYEPYDLTNAHAETSDDLTYFRTAAEYWDDMSERLADALQCGEIGLEELSERVAKAREVVDLLNVAGDNEAALCENIRGWYEFRSLGDLRPMHYTDDNGVEHEIGVVCG